MNKDIECLACVIIRKITLATYKIVIYTNTEKSPKNQKIKI